MDTEFIIPRRAVTAHPAVHGDSPLKRRRVSGAALLAAVVLCMTCSAGAPAQVHDHGDESFGVVDFPISAPRASQAQFNHAMTLLHHMTYPQARALFLRISRSDPGCAMAYWGFAMTLFQPLWPTRPDSADLSRGWEAVRMAESLNAPTERERLFIASADSFYRGPGIRDYWTRIRAWGEGMKLCYLRFPDDHEAEALYALSLLATVPQDQPSSPKNALAADILVRLLKENPRHPGAMHYLIHANDVPGRERESLEVLKEYEAIAPRNPHAIHMPTHIYTRLGDWKEVIRGNVRAAAAALEYPAGDRGQFVWDEYPHAIEYLMYACLQTGDDDSAVARLNRLRTTPGLEPSFKTAFHIASTQVRYELERRDWEGAASIVPRETPGVVWDRFPWPEAISWFGHGLGSLNTGNAAEARRARGRLMELEDVAAGRNETLFMRNIRILRLELTAWGLEKEGVHDSSVTVMTQAADIEASTPKHAVTPAPTLPALEQLGDLLLAQGKPAEARRAYDRSMETNPLRFNSLLGAARASRALGSNDAAAKYYRQLVGIADRGSHRGSLDEARSFLLTYDR